MSELPLHPLIFHQQLDQLQKLLPQCVSHSSSVSESEWREANPRSPLQLPLLPPDTPPPFPTILRPPAQGPDLDAVDRLGNTPLHLAVALGDEEAVRLLVLYGADVGAKNAQGWTALELALSTYPHVATLNMVMSLHLAYQRKLDRMMKRRMPGLLDALPVSFELEIEWALSTWVPFVNLPFDTYRIRKSGNALRVDTTLVGVDGMTCIRGDLSFVIHGGDPPVVLFLDHERQTWGRMAGEMDGHVPSQEEQEQEIELLLTSGVMDVDVHTSTVTFEEKVSWFGNVVEERVADRWNTRVFDVVGLRYRVRQKKKIELESRVETTWGDYWTGEAEQGEGMTRLMAVDGGNQFSVSKNCKATAWLSDGEDGFPIEMLQPLFELLAPISRQMRKMRDFFQVLVPRGMFPVKLEIPMVPTVTLSVVINDFVIRDHELEAGLFQVPESYALESMYGDE